MKKNLIKVLVVLILIQFVAMPKLSFSADYSANYDDVSQAPAIEVDMDVLKALDDLKGNQRFSDREEQATEPLSLEKYIDEKARPRSTERYKKTDAPVLKPRFLREPPSKYSTSKYPRSSYKPYKYTTPKYRSPKYTSPSRSPSYTQPSYSSRKYPPSYTSPYRPSSRYSSPYSKYSSPSYKSYKPRFTPSYRSYDLKKSTGPKVEAAKIKPVSKKPLPRPELKKTAKTVKKPALKKETPVTKPKTVKKELPKIETPAIEKSKTELVKETLPEVKAPVTKKTAIKKEAEKIVAPKLPAKEPATADEHDEDFDLDIISEAIDEKTDVSEVKTPKKSPLRRSSPLTVETAKEEAMPITAELPRAEKSAVKHTTPEIKAIPMVPTPSKADDMAGDNLIKELAAIEDQMAQKAPKPEVSGNKDLLTITFKDKLSDISEESKNSLNQLVEMLKLQDNTRVQIQAFAKGTKEDQSEARRVSLSRGLTVRSYLTEKGIKPVRLDIRALGSKTNKTPLDRVDVILME